MTCRTGNDCRHKSPGERADVRNARARGLLERPEIGSALAKDGTAQTWCVGAKRGDMVKSVLLGVLVVASCTPITGPAGPRTASDGNAFDGFDHCAQISESAGRRGSQLAMYGWALAFGAVGATAAGTTIIPLAEEGDLSARQKVAAASLTAAGITLAVTAGALFKRSDSASQLSGAAASVLGELDGDKPAPAEAAARCNAALAAWQMSRTDASAFSTALLQQDEEGRQRARQAEGSDRADQAASGRDAVTVDGTRSPEGSTLTSPSRGSQDASPGNQ